MRDPEDRQRFIDNLSYRFVRDMIRWVPSDMPLAQPKPGYSLLSLADSYAEEVVDNWPEGEGYGSSDYNADMADFLTSLGYKVEVIDNKYTVTGVREER